ncbi:Uncharacterised protein [Acinetobacter baumannii]|nr:Uncharacterised protein [Acinetobacter baumannii]SSQ41884.1 Uncharacterised protein [Acinetobacter baumannii]SVK01999.1 Uncharacterised protein [Acinetobacter baumannii]
MILFQSHLESLKSEFQAHTQFLLSELPDGLADNSRQRPQIRLVHKIRPALRQKLGHLLQLVPNYFQPQYPLPKKLHGHLQPDVLHPNQTY